eukprot:362193-Chlamydomonas_euryale.AAC.2
MRSVGCDSVCQHGQGPEAAEDAAQAQPQEMYTCAKYGEGARRDVLLGRWPNQGMRKPCVKLGQGLSVCYTCEIKAHLVHPSGQGLPRAPLWPQVGPRLSASAAAAATTTMTGDLHPPPSSQGDALLSWETYPPPPQKETVGAAQLETFAPLPCFLFPHSKQGQLTMRTSLRPLSRLPPPHTFKAGAAHRAAQLGALTPCVWHSRTAALCAPCPASQCACSCRSASIAGRVATKLATATTGAASHPERQGCSPGRSSVLTISLTSATRKGSGKPEARHAARSSADGGTPSAAAAAAAARASSPAASAAAAATAERRAASLAPCCVDVVWRCGCPSRAAAAGRDRSCTTTSI